MDNTAEQEVIINAATGTGVNLMISALAGCGKTTTLELIERAVEARPILYLCFNKKVAEDAATRMLSTTVVRTFNSMGHRVWASSIGRTRINLNAKKAQDILRAIIDEAPKRDRQAVWDCFWDVIHGVAMAKSLGYVPEAKFAQARRLCSRAEFHARLEEDPDDLTADLIDAVLTRSITAAYSGLIDYNDQVYMPAVFGGVFPRFPLVLIDEYQDLNPVNLALVDHLVKLRVIGVGDDAQSIYGFRGAVQGGMATAIEKFKMAELPLSTSFRCPQAIVENARWRVPEFKWIKQGGTVEHLKDLSPASIPDTIPWQKDEDVIDYSPVILCRNNAPLFACALRLLSCGRSVSVTGSDIGPKLVGLMRKLGPDNLSQAQALGAIEDWKAERLDKGNANAEDMAACMRVFVEAGDSLSMAIKYAEHVLSQKGSIRLMTGHKAKGLEWPLVYHLDPWLCREEEQDRNLRYVIQTRSMDQYYEINSKAIQWGTQ